MTPPLASLGALTLDPFTASGIRELYVIRNHPTVRPFMARSGVIAYRQHAAWAREKLVGATDIALWLVRPAPGARAIGFTQLRFNAARDTGEIGVIFREPETHRLPAALSTAITLHLLFTHFGCGRVDSYVIPGHEAAIAYNQAWGTRIVETDKPGMVKLSMSREECFANANYRKVMARVSRRLVVAGAGVAA